MKSTIVLGIGATLLASCSGNRQKAEEKVTQQQKKPNVIFLIADDIGYGDLSCNGSKTIHTPNVERLQPKVSVLRMRMRWLRPVRRRAIRCLRGIMLGGGMTRGLRLEMPEWSFVPNSRLLPICFVSVVIQQVL